MAQELNGREIAILVENAFDTILLNTCDTQRSEKRVSAC